jgi:hypothetical protein
MCISGYHSVVRAYILLCMLRSRKCAVFLCTPALRVCKSYAIRTARGNNTVVVEEKDTRAWTLGTCMNSTHALAL